MNLMSLNAQSAKAICVRFTKPHQRFSKPLAFIRQIIERHAHRKDHRNKALTCGYALNQSNLIDTSGTLSARSHKGFSASPKGLACAVAVAIGISLFLPLEQVSEASIMPTKSVLKSYTRTLLTANQYKCVSTLWGKESAWNYKADNPHSTAYGIPQILGMTTNNPYEQIHKGLIYISKRYHKPCKALAFHKKHGWY